MIHNQWTAGPWLCDNGNMLFSGGLWRVFSLEALLATAALIAPASAGCAPVYAHDPQIVREGAWYYMFSTGQGVPVSRSRDLAEWEALAPVFSITPAWTRKEVPGFAGDMWAPGISRQGGTYYLYYSVSTFGSNASCIGLATSATLDPSLASTRWVDRGMVVSSKPGRDDWNAIDGGLAVDDSGGWHLTFGSFWTGIKQVAIDPRSGKPPGDPSDVISIARRPSTPDDAIEAPFIFARSGLFYLFVSFDHCCRGAQSDYKVAVGRSRRIDGPYVDEDGVPMLDGGGTIILRGSGDLHGPGHCSVLRDAGRDLLVHHA
jgi:arabinan endo-1,5-alpha-L-arabinosidase